MPYEMKITGSDVKDFYQNAAHAFLLLSHGGNTVFATPPAAPTPEQQANRDAVEKVVVAEPVGDVTKTVVEKPPRKSRTTKAPETIDVKPEVVETKPAEADDDPLSLNDVAKPAADRAEAPTYTVDDMRQRVREIIAAHGPKSKDNPNARGNDMPTCVAYVRKLFAPFGVKLAAEVPPERFAEFINASQAYLDGTAE